MLQVMLGCQCSLREKNVGTNGHVFLWVSDNEAVHKEYGSLWLWFKGKVCMSLPLILGVGGIYYKEILNWGIEYDQGHSYHWKHGVQIQETGNRNLANLRDDFVKV